MRITLERKKDTTGSTGGILSVDGLPFCFTCEDEYREKKLAGKTRIPAGAYEIKLRNEGGMTKRYAKKFDFHQGMLWLQDVHDFKWVYIHIGNTHKDSAGCILVGYEAKWEPYGDCSVGSSSAAYMDLYKMILEAINAEERVFIHISPDKLEDVAISGKIQPI